ncbi:MAG: hypothetical protein QM760_15120 [Nibricoccus sp.]
MLLAYHATGDDKYLEPIRSMARIRAKYLKNPVGVEVVTDQAVSFFGSMSDSVKIDPSLEPGSEQWCAAQMGPMLSGALAGYRQLTGDTAFDEVLRRDGNGYVQFMLDGNRGALEKELNATALAFAQNKPAFTSEVRFTDRAFRLTPWYFNTVVQRPLPVPNTRLLYNTLTGDPTKWFASRLPAVRWLTPPQDLAALVVSTGKAQFAAELYHFGDRDRPMDIELYSLEKGRYTLTIDDIQGGEKKQLQQQIVSVAGSRTRVSIVVPTKRVCLVSLARAPQIPE